MTDIPAQPDQLAGGPGPSDVDAAAQERTLSLPVLCVLACLIGIVAALGAVIFRAMIALVHNAFFLGVFSATSDANHFDYTNPWGPFVILAPIVGGLIVVWMVQTFAPEAKGHGVPEVMYAVYHNKGDVRGVVAVVKSIASAISIGSGASVGREGPIIQIGASFGSTLARALGLPAWQKITLLSAGAGAGIAATFNTPLGGVMFAVELLLPEVSNRTFLPVVVATATATSIGRLAFGLDPAFYVPAAALPPSPPVNPIELTGFVLLGVSAGLVSWAFIRVLAFCEDFFPTLPGNAYTQNVIGMLLIGLLAYGFYLVTGHLHTAGVGYATIQAILDATPWTVLLLAALCVGKLLATTISLGAGASGGVFSPSLFIGATLGAGLGTLGQIIFPNSTFSVIDSGRMRNLPQAFGHGRPRWRRRGLKCALRAHHLWGKQGDSVTSPQISGGRRAVRAVVRFVVGIFVIGYAILDDLLFPLFRPLVRYLSGLRLFEALAGLIQRLPAYVVLAILAVPFVVIEPVKVFALWWLAVGHVVQGGVLLVFAHVLSILTLERLYHTGHAKLMTIGWFKRLMDWVTGIRDAVLARARATPAWQWAKKAGSDFRAWYRDLLHSAR